MTDEQFQKFCEMYEEQQSLTREANRNNTAALIEALGTLAELLNVKEYSFYTLNDFLTIAREIPI